MRDCHRASSRNLYVSTDEAFTIWLNSKAERMLAATDLTPRLVNRESMTSKLNAGGGSKDPVAWKIEKAVHYFVHADKVFYGLGKGAAAAGGLSDVGRGAATLQTSRTFLNTF